MNNKFSIIDLETTGSNRQGQKIIEIAIINYDGRSKLVEETFCTMVNPEQNINRHVSIQTGITNSKAMNAPYFYNVARKIVEMTKGRTIVAHDALYHQRFLKKEFMDLGYDFQGNFLNIRRIVKSLFPDLPSYKLEDLCDYFNIEQRQPAHHALNDSENCLKVWKFLLPKIPKEMMRRDNHA